MNPLMMLFSSLLSGVPGLIGEYFKQKNELAMLQLDTNRQIMLGAQKAAADGQIADSKRAIWGLRSTGRTFKYCVFWMFAAPFVLCLFGFTNYAQMIFNNLSILPPDYKMVFYMMVGVVWGIPVPGTIMGNVWEGIKTAVQNRRDFIIEKKHGPFDRKAYYDAIRAVKGAVTDADVKTGERVLDVMDKASNGSA